MKLICILTILAKFIIYNLGQDSNNENLVKNIELNGELEQFNAKSFSLQDPLDSDEKSLIEATNRVYTNDANIVMEQEVSSREEFDETVELTFTSSTQKFIEKFKKVTTKLSVALIFGFQHTVEESTKYTTVVTNGQTIKMTNTTKIVREQKDKVQIPPYQSVRVQTFLETVKDRKIPYTAVINVTGIAYMNEIGRFYSMFSPRLPYCWPSMSCDAGADLIKAEIKSLNYKIINEGEYWVQCEINGYIVASYALDFIMKSENIGSDQGNGFVMDAKHWWPILLIVVIIAYLIKYFIKKKLRVPEPQNPNNAIPMPVIEN